jgi:perosamine synthetase
MSAHEIPLSRPDITDVEIDLVTQVMRSGRLSIGPMQERFEQLVAARTGRRHAVAVSSGTCGLHLALLALGVGRGDEVITTPFSFIASSNCILMVGARPVFVDICPRSLNMDPELVEQAITPRTRAIVAVECFGNPAHMADYAAIAARRGIPMVEDCCEALGCSANRRPAGSFGDIGVFGFYPNKQVTTGEGGMIVTDDKRLADLCTSMRSQGRPIRPSMRPDSNGASALGSWLTHERLGYNYRLSEVSAAIGVGQMRRFDEIVRRRQEVAAAYMGRLMSHPEIVLPTVEPGITLSWFVFVARLASGFGREERDRIIDGMRRHEIGAADYFPCIHLQPFYQDKFGFRPGDFPIAESVSQRTIALPFFNGITEEQIDLVCQTLEVMIQREALQRA